MPKAGPEPHNAMAVLLPYQYATTPWPPSSVPLLTASSSPNAGTTAPEGSNSIFRREPPMSLTFLTKSLAYSWKMSFAGQVLWKRRVVVWALETIGNPRAAVPAVAAAALERNFRRVGAASFLRTSITISLVVPAPVWSRLFFVSSSPRLPVGPSHLRWLRAREIRTAAGHSIESGPTG